MTKFRGLGVAVVLAFCAAPTLAAVAQDDEIDVTDTGQHDAKLGAVVFVSGIGRTEARFEFCGWPAAEWTPVREQAMALAPRIYAKAGLPPQQVASQIEETRARTLASAAKVPKAPQCVASRGAPLDQRALDWMQAAMGWGHRFLGG
jgi:hypothetical protein